VKELIQKRIIVPAIISLLLFPFYQFIFNPEIASVCPAAMASGLVAPGLVEENAMEALGAHQSLFAPERYLVSVCGHNFGNIWGVSSDFILSNALWIVLLFFTIITLMRLILEVVYKHDGKKPVLNYLCVYP
jgi:hypothetical protein